MRANTNATRTISPRVSPNVTASYYHGVVIFVRTSEEKEARGHSAKDLAADGGTTKVVADTPVALAAAGPFVPLASAIEEDSKLRDVLARDLPIPSLRTSARTRAAIAALGVLPVIVLVMIDARAKASAHVVVDLVLALYVAFELTRPTPRLPAAAALAFVAVALRLTSFIARLCARDLPAYVYLAPAAAAIAAGIVLVRMPSRSRVGLELLDRLGITRIEAREVIEGASDPPAGALVGAALAAAVALPALLHLMRRGATHLLIQAAVFVAYAALVPSVARRISSSEVAPPVAPRRILWGIFVGFAMTAAVMTAARSFVDTGTAFAFCVDRLDLEARAFVAKEQAEMANAIVRVKASALLFGLVAIVFPLAEERVYRGLLQDTLVKKYGTSYGLFASAVVFGVAHVGVYQIGIYQTVLLGVAFGVAYLEGGIVASIVVHALWNLVLLA